MHVISLESLLEEEGRIGDTLPCLMLGSVRRLEYMQSCMVGHRSPSSVHSAIVSEIGQSRHG
jgi:hypothetical protein